MIKVIQFCVGKDVVRELKDEYAEIEIPRRGEYVYLNDTNNQNKINSYLVIDISHQFSTNNKLNATGQIIYVSLIQTDVNLK